MPTVKLRVHLMACYIIILVVYQLKIRNNRRKKAEAESKMEFGNRLTQIECVPKHSTSTHTEIFLQANIPKTFHFNTKLYEAKRLLFSAIPCQFSMSCLCLYLLHTIAGVLPSFGAYFCVYSYVQSIYRLPFVRYLYGTKCVGFNIFFHRGPHRSRRRRHCCCCQYYFTNTGVLVETDVQDVSYRNCLQLTR